MDDSNKKPKLAIFIDWFEPGFKAGGPIRSIVNLSRLLQAEVEIFIFTSDRDHGDPGPYPNVETDKWLNWEHGTKVWYSSPDKRKEIESQVRRLKPEAVYINSLFSLSFAIAPLRYHYAKSIARQVILVPRGMLHSGALQYGKVKKRVFLTLKRVLGIHRKITWQATDSQEKQDIIKRFGSKSRIIEVGNVPTVFAPRHPLLSKTPGKLSMLFVSRVQPKKNLEFLLDLMSRATGEIQLDIVGPIEDKPYWEGLKAKVSTLPSTHTVNYLGAFPHHEIMEIQQKYHLFCLPTHGENFGHAIFDALLGGLPLLISDQTPWKDLSQKRCGWEIPLSDIQSWDTALKEAISWNSSEFERASSSASKFANKFLTDSNLKQQYLDLFFPQ